MNFKFQMMTGVALTVLALAPAVAAHAQSAGANQIADVVVTATHTGATNVQKTPIVVDVVSGSDLKKDDIENPHDLTQAVPSLVFTTTAINAQVYIRGVGGYQGGEQDVSFYTDGVYMSRVSTILQTNFNDLDRIEVAEGPQGTVFGRNANGGAINFISKTPPDHFTFSNQFQTGNYALIDDAASIGGPLADNIQGLLSFSHVQHDGYLYNIDPGVGNPDAANRTAVRGQVRWEPTSNITNTLRADYLYTHELWATNDTLLSTGNVFKGTGCSAGCVEPFPVVNGINFLTTANSIIGQYGKVDSAELVYQNEIAYGVSDEFNDKINDNLTLKSISALRTDHSFSPQDQLTEVYYSGYSWALYEEYQLSQEFNLINTYGPLSGVAGLYYFDEHVKQIGFVPTLAPNPQNTNPTTAALTWQSTLQPTISRAAFIDETYHITPTLGLEVGVRYTADHKTLNTNNYTWALNPGQTVTTNATGNGTIYAAIAPSKYGPATNVYDPYIADLNQDNSATTPKVAVNWQATPNAMLYASATAGFKSGGYSNTARSTLGANFGPEHMWAYEGGAKTDWLDHTLRFNISAFYYTWTGLQFSSCIGPTLCVVSNAGNANVKGLEINTTYKPSQIKGLTLTANATLLNSDYVNFATYTLPAALNPVTSGYAIPGVSAAKITQAGTNYEYNASGNQLVNAPDVAFNLSGQQDFDLPDGADLSVRATYEYTSRDYFDPSNAAVASRAPLGLVGASMTYAPAHSHWTVGIWGKNLTNDLYINGISAGSTISAPNGDPRTFGLRINYTY